MHRAVFFLYIYILKKKRSVTVISQKVQSRRKNVKGKNSGS